MASSDAFFFREISLPTRSLHVVMSQAEAEKVLSASAQDRNEPGSRGSKATAAATGEREEEERTEGEEGREETRKREREEGKKEERKGGGGERTERSTRATSQARYGERTQVKISGCKN